MPVTNFNYGFLAGVTVRGVPILQSNPGNVYWVGNGPVGGSTTNYTTRFSGGSDNNSGTFQKPFATIAQALSVCSQGAGDIILVKPGHVEVCNAVAGGMAVVYDQTGLNALSTGGTVGYSTLFNVAGVAIVGMGVGNLRPTIIWSTATGATIPVRASGMSIQGFRFLANFAAVVSAFTGIASSSATSTVIAATAGGVPCLYNAVGAVSTIWPGAALTGSTVLQGTTIVSQYSGTANGIGTYIITPAQAAVTSFTAITGPWDFNIESCDFIDLGTALNFLAGVTTPAGANCMSGLRVANCRHLSIASSGAISLIKLGSNLDRLIADNNFSTSAAAITGGAIIAGSTFNMTNAQIMRNVVYRPTVTASTAIVVSSSSTACTGMMYDNYGWCLGATTLLISTGTVLGFANNFCSITGTADKNATQNPLLT